MKGKGIYSSTILTILVLLMSILVSFLSFFTEIDFGFGKNEREWKIYNAISNSLYDSNADNETSKIFRYYLKSNKDKEDETFYVGSDDYDVIDSGENFTQIQREDGTIIVYTQINEDLYTREITYTTGSVKMDEVSEAEYLKYRPNQYEIPTVTNYLTNDKVFIRKYGRDFKFEPSTMTFNDGFVYMKGSYKDGKVVIREYSKAPIDPEAYRLFNTLEDGILDGYRDLDDYINEIDFAYAIDITSPAYIDYINNENVINNLIPRIVIFSFGGLALLFLFAMFLRYDKLETLGLYRAFERIPFDFGLILIMIVFGLGTIPIAEMSYALKYLELFFTIQILLVFILGLGVLYLVYELKGLLNKGGKSPLVRNSIIFRIFALINRLFSGKLKALTNNLEGTNLKTAGLVYVVLLGIGFFGSLITRAPMLVFILWIILITILFAFFKRYYDDILEIQDTSQRVAVGDFSTKIDEENTRFKTLAHNLNTVSDNLDLSVEKAIKSERMKTELITNVSHDLKTPLTSIINYSELLLDENLDEDTRKDYAQVINDKSHKLKVLIESLFEISKVTSNNVDLNMKDIDFSQLLEQVVGEWNDKLEEKNITTSLFIPEKPIIIKLDGNQTYRVLENVFSNIYKYAMENTRVYADLLVKDRVELVVKNISKYPLNISPDELIERFTRGDASRNTEGSGLGLSIASSLTEVQGGEFKIDIDGDLFKIIIRF